MAGRCRQMARIHQRWAAGRANSDRDTTGETTGTPASHITDDEASRCTNGPGSDDSARLASDQRTGAAAPGTSRTRHRRRSVVELGCSNDCRGNEPDDKAAERREKERSTRTARRSANAANQPSRSYSSAGHEEVGDIAT